jgi:hypothetical protein
MFLFLWLPAEITDVHGDDQDRALRLTNRFA